ncbi:MAG: hypothetical protein P4N60_13515 [Verrucomicrobiae bacterium]|nr:hypothetical protein [Verrucomicrobiae bacterium]
MKGARLRPALTTVPPPLAWFKRMMQTEKHQAPGTKLPRSTEFHVSNPPSQIDFDGWSLKFQWTPEVAGMNLEKN